MRGYNVSLALTIATLFLAVVTHSFAWMVAAAAFYTLKNLFKTYVVKEIIERNLRDSCGDGFDHPGFRNVRLRLIETIKNFSFSCLGEVLKNFTFEGNSLVRFNFFGLTFLHELGSGIATCSHSSSSTDGKDPSGSESLVNALRVFVKDGFGKLPAKRL